MESTAVIWRRDEYRSKWWNTAATRRKGNWGLLMLLPRCSTQRLVVGLEGRTALRSCSPPCRGLWWYRSTSPASPAASETASPWPETSTRHEPDRPVPRWTRTSQGQLSSRPHLLVEVANLVGEHAMFVCQEAETPLFLQQRLLAAIGDKLLHVHLSWRQGLHVLRTEVRGQHGGCSMSLNDQQGGLKQETASLNDVKTKKHFHSLWASLSLFPCGFTEEMRKLDRRPCRGFATRAFQSFFRSIKQRGGWKEQKSPKLQEDLRTRILSAHICHDSNDACVPAYVGAVMHACVSGCTLPCHNIPPPSAEATVAWNNKSCPGAGASQTGSVRSEPLSNVPFCSPRSLWTRTWRSASPGFSCAASSGLSWSAPGSPASLCVRTDSAWMWPVRQQLDSYWGTLRRTEHSMKPHSRSCI